VFVRVSPGGQASGVGQANGFDAPVQNVLLLTFWRRRALHAQDHAGTKLDQPIVSAVRSEGLVGLHFPCYK
jgi:hypothetical protein